MWHYHQAGRFQQPLQAQSPGPQSSLDVLLGLRGMAITLLCPDPAVESLCIATTPGFLEEVTAGGLTLLLAAPLPAAVTGLRFGVEVPAGSNILRFFAAAHQPVAVGATRITLALPRQIESVQRRKFSRVRTIFTVVFAAAGAPPGGGPEPSGQGQALDLSAGGLRLTAPMPLREDQVLFLSFIAPDGTAFRGLEGKVARAQSDGSRTVAAVQFTNLTPDVENSLVQTVFRLQLGSPAKR